MSDPPLQDGAGAADQPGVIATRSFATACLADEALAEPALLRAYARAFAPGEDATLVLWTSQDATPELADRVVRRLTEEALSDHDVLLLADAGAEPHLAATASAVLTHRPVTGPLAAVPAVGADHIDGLRALAEATWTPPFIPRERYERDLRTYSLLGGASEIGAGDLNPQLDDATATTPFDQHYFFQDVWAARRVADVKPARHVDVGSRIDYVGFLTAICPVTFVDIRPLVVDIEDFECVTGSILDLPFADRSLESVSCLHVAEHIGLGRYGDPLDPLGTRKACAELQRVLAPGGRLLFSGPVGRARTCFNAHRVHDPRAVVGEFFAELELVEFSGVDDAGVFRRHRDISELEGSEYACGMFLFRRPEADDADGPAAPAAPPAAKSPLHAFYAGLCGPGDLVFDVGANHGNRAEVFLDLGAEVVAVEPQAELAAALRHRWDGEARLHVLECGLGEREGEQELFVADADTITSMSPDWIEAMRASGRFDGNTWEQVRVVPVTTLDSVIARHGVPRFVKIDVEGFEAQVLSGLSRPVPLVSLEFCSETEGSTRRCVELLDALGMTEFNLSLGESMELHLSAWVGADELLALLPGLPGELPWGDVYARLPRGAA